MRTKQTDIAPSKRERLTLSQLAGYDDILTDALVDHVSVIHGLHARDSSLAERGLQVYYWTTIRKNRSKYNLTRGINEDDITHTLLHELVVAKDAQKAEASLLKLPGLRKYNDNLNSVREKEDFRRHLRKYINIWNTDCPFEVSTTNRYTIVTHEAAVFARCRIKKGDTIKYLCGQLVSMTAEEELDRDLTRRDFSIVMSSRKKTPSFFLGPARFANHDCDANARLVTRGAEGMEVVAARDIDVGDEITVTYGENYFGEDNCECLCESCEKKGRGGWPPQEKSRSATGTVTPAETGLEAPGPYGLRSSKRRASHSDLSSMSMTPDCPEGSPRKRARVSNKGLRPDTDQLNANTGQSNGSRQLRRQASGLRNELVPNNKAQAPPESSRAKAATAVLKQNRSTPEEEDDLVASVKAAFAKAKSHTKRKRDTEDLPDINESTKKTKVSLPDSSSRSALLAKNSLPIIDVPETPSTPSNPRLTGPDLIVRRQQSSVSPSGTSSIRGDSIPPSSTPATSLDPNDITNDTVTNPVKAEPSECELLELSDSAAIDDTNSTIISSPTTFRKPVLPASAVLPTVELPSSEVIQPPKATTATKSRTPGDYIRTPLLLGEKYSRWVDCRTCSSTWVQANSYLTRKECPRCERHSKLYGYRWPKTEKTANGDAERVMDHRTVHRFIKPEEERRIRKRGRGLTAEEREDVEDEVEDKEEEEVVVEKPVEKKKKKQKPKTRPGWKGWVELPIKRGRGRPRKNKGF